MHSIPHRFAHLLDLIIDRLATLLSHVTPLEAAGFFYEPQHSYFWDVWTETGRTMCVRMGRFEFSASLRPR